MKLNGRLKGALVTLSTAALMTSTVNAASFIDNIGNFGKIWSAVINVLPLILYGVALFCLVKLVITLMGLADDRNQKATPKAAAIYAVTGLIAFFIPSFLDGAATDVGVTDKISNKIDKSGSGSNLKSWE